MVSRRGRQVADDGRGMTAGNAVGPAQEDPKPILGHQRLGG